MIAEDRLGFFESLAKILTAPIWLPIGGVVQVARRLRERWAERRQPQAEAQLIYTPRSDLERAVFAAMILAGRPVTNAELARLMGCSPGEASKRVRELEGVVRKERIGREVRLSLPHLLN